jgi:peptidoglycan/xylan/chitin deacetylase (PgdA/CDA1 family)
MAEWGFHFGNHGVTHSSLGELPYDQVAHEIAAASEDLIRELGANGAEKWFSHPHGMPRDITEDVMRACRECGVTACFSAYGGTNLPGCDSTDILRQGVNFQFGELAFRALLQGWHVRT